MPGGKWVTVGGGEASPAAVTPSRQPKAHDGPFAHCQVPCGAIGTTWRARAFHGSFVCVRWSSPPFGALPHVYLQYPPTGCAAASAVAGVRRRPSLTVAYSACVVGFLFAQLRVF